MKQTKSRLIVLAVLLALLASAWVGGAAYAESKVEDLTFWVLFLQNDNVVMVETVNECHVNHVFLENEWRVWHPEPEGLHYWYVGDNQTRALVRYFDCENR